MPNLFRYAKRGKEGKREKRRGLLLLYAHSVSRPHSSSSPAGLPLTGRPCGDPLAASTHFPFSQFLSIMHPQWLPVDSRSPGSSPLALRETPGGGVGTSSFSPSPLLVS